MIDVDVDDYLEPSLHVDSSLAGVLINHYYILLSIASCGEIYSNMQSRCESVICTNTIFTVPVLALKYPVVN